jgi:mannose-6-phosphate isomerase-like protein (cupin superfamily)
LRFNGTRVAPSLAGVEVARSRRRGAFPADRGAIGGRRAEGREDAHLQLRGSFGSCVLRVREGVHNTDQLLVVTGGRGFVATETEEPEITVGDVVHIKAGERHCHGAKADSAMSHITVTTPVKK